MKSISSILYGTEEGINYFVQTCCNTEHSGEKCNCKGYGENLTKKKALKIANKLSRKFKVPIHEF